MFWNKKKNTTEPIITHCAFHCDETSKGKIIYGKLEVFKIGDKVSIDEMFYTISDFWYNVDRGYIMYSIKRSEYCRRAGIRITKLQNRTKDE